MSHLQHYPRTQTASVPREYTVGPQLNSPSNPFYPCEESRVACEESPVTHVLSHQARYADPHQQVIISNSYPEFRSGETSYPVPTYASHETYATQPSNHHTPQPPSYQHSILTYPIPENHVAQPWNHQALYQTPPQHAIQHAIQNSYPIPAYPYALGPQHAYQNSYGRAYPSNRNHWPPLRTNDQYPAPPIHLPASTRISCPMYPCNGMTEPAQVVKPTIPDYHELPRSPNNRIPDSDRDAEGEPESDYDVEDHSTARQYNTEGDMKEDMSDISDMSDKDDEDEGSPTGMSADFSKDGDWPEEGIAPARLLLGPVVGKNFDNMLQGLMYLRAVARHQGYALAVTSHKTEEKRTLRIYLACSRSGQHRSKATSRTTSTKKTDCKFQVSLNFWSSSQTWKVTMNTNRPETYNHNHEPFIVAENLATYRRLTKAQKKEICILSDAGLRP
ncbi:hypothetical protein DFH28DRAFT_1116899 [Melampsora americana]|nr:hypothetical protein DFH28DRAFT_1116899 [Melampsora americana]